MDSETCACVTLGTNTNRATGWMNDEELNPHRNTIPLPRRTFVKLKGQRRPNEEDHEYYYFCTMAPQIVI